MARDDYRLYSIDGPIPPPACVDGFFRGELPPVTLCGFGFDLSLGDGCIDEDIHYVNVRMNVGQAQ